MNATAAVPWSSFQKRLIARRRGCSRRVERRARFPKTATKRNAAGSGKLSRLLMTATPLGALVRAMLERARRERAKRGRRHWCRMESAMMLPMSPGLAGARLARVTRAARAARVTRAARARGATRVMTRRRGKRGVPNEKSCAARKLSFCRKSS
ncbi:hypothetical protein B0T25DRAFT_558833 [Lasiosphaeria hispida]|uniref:Uncharacterized protein n=1 Tax=Lasiosphaeria hispida TaxID=260671 RepID=A0AAJ0M8G1_9PEZI|nr:hypothetical protein B0T25DRAFT_558833 [Lasiosphaeria hispida]